jgi:hypothetical protein
LWLDYDRDSHLDLFVCNYVQFDRAKVPVPGQSTICQWKAMPVMCGPRGLPGDTNSLYHNNGDGTFTDVSARSGILKPGPRYSITPVSYDFDNDGWPDIFVAVDSEPSILYHNNHDGTFTDIAVVAGCAYNEDGQEQAGMGVGVADYDCDGWLDIFKTNFSDDTPDLDHNNGDGTTTTMAGPTSSTSRDTSTRKWTVRTSARASRPRGLFIRTSATADSRTFRPRWVRGSASASRAAALPSETSTTTAMWTSWS